MSDDRNVLEGTQPEQPAVRQRTRQRGGVPVPLPEDVQHRQGTASVRRATYEGREQIDEAEYTQTVEVPFYGDVALGDVTVEGGITRNMGNFNSVRVGVTLRLPCLPEFSEVERAYDAASRWVSGKVQDELSIAMEERGEDAPSPQPQSQGDRELERQQAARIRRLVRT